MRQYLEVKSTGAHKPRPVLTADRSRAATNSLDVPLHSEYSRHEHAEYTVFYTMSESRMAAM
jgi:hypothetical protein